MNAATIARLKITLDNVEPKVLRRIEVPLSIRLDRLHMTLQGKPPVKAAGYVLRVLLVAGFRDQRLARVAIFSASASALRRLGS